MPDPLEVFCSCRGGRPDEITCELDLTAIISFVAGTQGQHFELRGVLDGVETIIHEGGASGSWAVAMDPRWSLLENWSTITMYMWAGRSTSSAEYETAAVNFSIRQHYACTNHGDDAIEEWDIDSYSTTAASDCDHGIAPGCPDCWQKLQSGSGNITAYIFCSSPLHIPDMVQGEVGSFSPEPIPYDQLADNAAGNPEVFCATGGYPPYKYQIFQGSLPGGKSMDDSGHVTGTLNGTPGSTYLGIRVTDATGQTAEKICIQNACPPCTMEDPGNAWA